VTSSRVSGGQARKGSESSRLGDETSNAIRNVFLSLCVYVRMCVCARVTSCSEPSEEFSPPTEGNAHSRSSVSNTPWDLQHGRRPLSSNAVTHRDLFPCAFFFSAALRPRCSGDRSRNADITRSRCVDPRCGGLGVFALGIDNAPTTIIRQALANLAREIDPRTIRGGRVCRCTRDPRRGRGKKGRDRTTERTVRGVHARTSGMPLASDLSLPLSFSLPVLSNTYESVIKPQPPAWVTDLT